MINANKPTSPTNPMNWVPCPVLDAARAAHKALHLEECKIPKIAGIDFSIPPPNPLASNPTSPQELLSSTASSTARALGTSAKLGLVFGAAGGYGPLFAWSFARAAGQKLAEETARHRRGAFGVLLHLDPVAKKACGAGLRAGYDACEAVTKDGKVFVPVAAGVVATTTVVGVPAAAATAAVALTAGTAKLLKNTLEGRRER